MNMVKTVLLLKSKFWSQILCTIQKGQKVSFESQQSCFHGALFDYSHCQIPGQGESQELHFGQLHVFILRMATKLEVKKQHKLKAS